MKRSLLIAATFATFATFGPMSTARSEMLAAGAPDLLGALPGRCSLQFGAALGGLGQCAFGGRRKQPPLSRLAGRIVGR